MGIDVMVINVENKDITPEELKEFCRKSGVHIYCDKRTVVYANKGFVFMHTGESAEHNFTAFGKTEFTDLYTGEKVKFPLKLPLGKSFLFKAE